MVAKAVDRVAIMRRRVAQCGIAALLLGSIGSLSRSLASIEAAQVIREQSLQISILLGVFTAIPVVVAFLKNREIGLGLWLINTIVTVLLLYPAAERPDLLLFISIIFLVESHLWLTLPFSAIFSSVPPLLAVAANQFTVDAVAADPSLADRLLLAGLLYAICLSSVICFRFLQNELAVTRPRMAQLQRDVLNLTGANVGFQHYVALVEQRTMEEERKRISRDLHDTTGYVFATIRMTFEAVKGLLLREPKSVPPVLDKGIALCDEGLEQTRRAVRQLRDIEAARSTGLSYVSKIARNFENATGMHVALDFSNTRRAYGPAVEEAVHRMVQEGLTNAFRHGNASEVHIVLTEHASRLHISIRDNGRGAKRVDRDVGLSGMDERISNLGGQLSVSSDLPGFGLHAEIPVTR